ncbi:MAG TPA: hypothetical protein VLW75_03215 [Rhizomicrobium sp.]|nr:hypothetical protein [Rhizomicrobium sp.]
MQPDLPWNVVGIPSEAREAARASARREGLSVGEWLTRRILGVLRESDTMDIPARSWLNEPARESEEMLARVTRSESEAQNAYRRIEDQLRVLSRRLDATERSQSENGRAMNKAATEISIASREQAQAFDQLGNHVLGLSDRLKRVEQHTANESLRDAVKALHLGLTRLADQIATTANQSASQIAAVAGNVESVAVKLADARRQSENISTALDERLRSIEESDGLAELRDKVNRLEDRLYSGNVEARVEHIEHAITDVSARLDQADARVPASVAIEESLRAFSARLDESEKRQRETVAELQTAIREMLSRPPPQASALESHAPAAAPQRAAEAPFVAPPQMAAAADAAQFDLPPFPEQPQRVSHTELFGEPAEAPPPPFEAEAAPAFAAQPEPGESFLSAARRSAREAAAAEAETRPGFNWGFTRPQPEETPKKGTRYFLIGGVAIVALALIAGLVLSRNHHRIVVPKNFGAQFSRPVHAKAKIQPPPAIKPSTTVTETAPPKPAEPVKQAEAKPVPAKPAPKPVATPPAPVTPAEHLAALANGGNPAAELLFGLEYLDGDGTAVNEAEAARWFERAAAQGEAVAEYRLGTLYERGRGVPADPVKAAQWYAAAAKLGNRKAMHNLGVAYSQGSGVKKDYTLAAQWFLKAANLGLADSQFNLAVLYERGLGVPQSLLDAYKWYAIAAAQGDTESRARIDALATQLRASERSAAQRAAARFKPKPLDGPANKPPEISSLPPA